MIQAFGLTSTPRKDLPPAVDDVSFEARAGQVTALLGAPGSGKTTALKLMLHLQPGRGVTHFRGRALHRVAHPLREVGALLGDVPGHPARTIRGHLRLLCAAAGVPARRADEVLEELGLVSLGGERLGDLSLGTDRRVGLACVLLANPHALVLDEPTVGLSPREGRDLHTVLRAHADRGGTVLFTTADPKEAARAADHVVTLEQGSLVADQDATSFARTRLRPRVTVRSPHAARLEAVLTKEARVLRRSVEVVREDGNRLMVYGSNCADVGDVAFRNGILVHQLADETGDMGSRSERKRSTGTVGPQVPGGTAGGVGTGADGRADSSADTGAVEGAYVGADVGGDTGTSIVGHAEGESRGPGRRQHGSRRRGVRKRRARQSKVDTVEFGLIEFGLIEAESLPVDDTAVRRLEGDGPGKTVDPQDAAGSPGVGGIEGTDGTRDADADRARGAQDAEDAEGAEGMEGAEGAVPSRVPVPVRTAPAPLRPLRYELRRVRGVGTVTRVGGVVLVVSALLAVFLGGVGHTPGPRLLAAWPVQLPLPPAALGAGLLGALAYGDEFRYAALTVGGGTVPRRVGLLMAKALVAAGIALPLALLTVVCDGAVLSLVHGSEVATAPADWPLLMGSWLGLAVGCAWAGVLAAGLFRSTSAGLAAVVAVPVVVVPLVQEALNGLSVRDAAGLPARLRQTVLEEWPFDGGRQLAAWAQTLVQPFGGALALSLTTLLAAYLVTTVRGRFR